MKQLFILLVCTSIFGCHTYKPVRVTLRDAETHLPIAGAVIEPQYRYFLDPYHPDVSPHTTGPDGSTIIPIAIGKNGLPESNFEGLWMSGFDADAPDIPAHSGQPRFPIPSYVFCEPIAEVSFDVISVERWREKWQKKSLELWREWEERESRKKGA